MERRQGTYTLVHLVVCNFCFFGCFVFFIVTGEVRGKVTNNENLSRGNFLDDQTSGHSSSTDGKSMLLETTADSVTLPLQYQKGALQVTKLGLGTPPQTLTFAILPALDVSWTQCRPCTLCYKEESQLFDPSNSSTYKNVPCNSQSCITGCVDESSCSYYYSDGDSTRIIGGMSTDVLSLNEKEAVAGFVFGCGKSSSVTADYVKGVDGYFGLGTGPQSFLSKTANRFNKTFSYCLPLDGNSSGFLSLGGHAVASNSVHFVPFSKTVPLETAISPSNYVLDLVGISVGAKSLPIGLSASKPLPILIDAGTDFSLFPGEIYSVMRDNFRALMSKYRILSESPLSNLDTCFDLSGHANVTVPAIDLSFSNGVDIPLVSRGVLYQVNSTVSCFAFSESRSEYSVLGIIQQRAFGIIYDNPNNRIGFGKGVCPEERPLDPVAVSAAAPWTLPSVATMFVFLVLT